MEKLVVTLFALALCLTACQTATIQGSGKVISQMRDVSGFNRVSLGAWGDATLVQGSEEGVEIRTDDNIMDYVTAEVRNGVLYLEIDPRARVNVKPTKGITYLVKLKTLNGIAVSGAGDVSCEALTTDSLDIAVSGAGTVTLGSIACRELSVAVSGAGDLAIAGEAQSQSIAISGAGSYSAGDLLSASASISISGTGDARVWATDALDVHVSGTGSVLYYGEPRVTKSVSGVGSVTGLGMHGTSI